MYPVSEQASVRSGQMKAHCISMLRKDADEAGVVLLVLDARDATGARKAGRVRGGGKAARTRCRAGMLRHSLKVFRPMIPPMPFPSVNPDLEAHKLSGRTKELRFVQPEHVLQIADSPGNIIDKDEGIRGQKVIKLEDPDDPTSDYGFLFFSPYLIHSNTLSPHVTRHGDLAHIRADEGLSSLHIQHNARVHQDVRTHLLNADLLPVLLDLLSPHDISRRLNLDHPRSSLLVYASVLRTE
ncbi:hypothetical protein EDB89DRAFT_2231069 [Lactarius sanguifluus]|nr:hypothetical protein EDB89DRAFT_2231069 [Lactarius sanguifluus]